MTKVKKILILFAHPAQHKSRTNNRIITTIQDQEGITINNLYQNYPDFHIDIKREQRLLLEHDIIVWQHPFYWYSAPAIIKEWIDLVLQHGFAYGKEGQALAGKTIFNAITAGGSKQSYTTEGYNSQSIRQYLSPFQQTAKKCKMHYLPPFVIHGTHLLEHDQITQSIKNYSTILKTLQNNVFTLDELMAMTYLNDILIENTKV